MFGNAWAVRKDAVVARQHVSNRRGRPLSARAAWEAILKGRVDLSNVSRFRNRGVVHRYEMSNADHEFLAQQNQALVSGVAAAAAYEEGVSVSLSEAYLYVSESLHQQVSSKVAAVPDDLGSVIIRVVHDDLWNSIVEGEPPNRVGGRLAPRAAVAIDLMESADPRHWIAAKNLLSANA